MLEVSLEARFPSQLSIRLANIVYSLSACSRKLTITRYIIPPKRVCSNLASGRGAFYGLPAD